jgi:hypothetical protein
MMENNKIHYVDNLRLFKNYSFPKIDFMPKFILHRMQFDILDHNYQSANR